MSEQQQQRVCFYHQDDGTSSSESRSEATHCPSMEASASVDQSVNIPTPPGGAIQSVPIPLPPVASTALPPQRPPINNLERMEMAVIPIPPSVALDHPQQSTSTKVANSQRQPSMITVDFGTPDCGQLRDLLLNSVAGDMPALDECQALEQAELATSDVDDDFLHMLHMFKLWHGADFPPSNIPYNKDLDRHIMQVMWQISANIQHLVRSQVQHVQAGQYMVDMIDLLEVLCHPHVGYSLQPYTGGPPYPSRQSVIEMVIVYLGCHIEVVCQSVLGYEGARSPHPGDHITGKLQSTVASILPANEGCQNFPIAHEYFQHTWPLQWLSMGDWIDEWMEEKQILGNIRREGP
ncbi:hypothetical protein F5141DRAFT_1068371 [Pisolithus sp. B1]|nr:hypothetical protein F5141DRAFT_1068371 [Pisolithus sp. B1]